MAGFCGRVPLPTSAQHEAAPRIIVDLSDDTLIQDVDQDYVMPSTSQPYLTPVPPRPVSGQSHDDLNRSPTSRPSTVSSALSAADLTDESRRTSLTDMSDISSSPAPKDTNHSQAYKDNISPISVSTLNGLLEQRSIDAFLAVGGINGLETSLTTNRYSGINARDIHAGPENERTLTFGRNKLPEKQSKSFPALLWSTFNDMVLLLLTGVAAISLALGLYQTFGQPHKSGEPRVEWVEGLAILIAVCIVVVVGAVNEYHKEKQFVGLNRKKADRVVNAIRCGKSCEISIYGVMVGDILHLQPGDVLPADGVLVSGYNVRCDESVLTGEAKPKRKSPGDQITDASSKQLDPFVISGTTVLEGIGTYLVTGVGENCTHGRLMMSLTEEDIEPTLLQIRLTAVAEQIATAGVAVAVFLFFALLMKFLWEVKWGVDSPAESGQYAQCLLRMVIVSITVVVVAVPEGLPLAVTLALAFAVTRMLKDMNLVRVPGSCETMAHITSICCDKTGTLTKNKMAVVSGLFGTKHEFGERTPAKSWNDAVSIPRALSTAHFIALLSEAVRCTLAQSIVINSTAFEGDRNSSQVFVGSPTESALLSFAQERLGIKSVAVERANTPTTLQIPFDSNRKYMVSIVDTGGVLRLYIKGAPEVLLAKCSRIVTDVAQGLDQTAALEEYSELVQKTMESYGHQSLRMIALAYRDIPLSEYTGTESIVDVDHLPLHNMTLLGIFGIRDPLRSGVEDAVAVCQKSGVTVRMITGDNVGTAVAVASECGILGVGDVVLDGPVFRGLSKEEMYNVIPRLKVLARSSAGDKRILVKRLREMGEVVAVTGDGTNDGPALRAADVGLSMGIAGSEIAREASSIILMDDNFASIVKAMEWGRTVYDAVKKFLQFQLTVNITAVTLTCFSAITSGADQSLLTPVQLLWVNLIMDTFAALALATDPPGPGVLDRKPQTRNAPLITPEMWKMIIAQATYQLVVVLALVYIGPQIIHYIGTEDSLETLVFNVYVWMQFFNQYNNRRLDNKLNVLEGICRNWYFIGINLVTILGQVLIICFGGSAVSVVPLSPAQWGISILLGAISLVVGVMVRLIPNELARIWWGRLKSSITRCVRRDEQTLIDID